MTTRAVFLDLNGTLVMPLVVERPDQLQVIDGIPGAVARLSQAGFACPVVTIQSRIAKGQFSMDQFLEWFETFRAELREAGGHILGPYVCPHRFKDPCACKKPSPLLYQRASHDHGLDLPRSFVIGDSAADVAAARSFGGCGCLVRTGYGSDEGEVARARPDASYIAASFAEAVSWVLRQPEPPG
jgi:D-glycero-D-manno-heptose 1,7-bisphosphate phosphatase